MGGNQNVEGPTPHHRMVGGSLQKKVLEGVFKTNKNYIICSNYFKDNFCRVPSSFHFVKMRVVSANHVRLRIDILPKRSNSFCRSFLRFSKSPKLFCKPQPLSVALSKDMVQNHIFKRFSDLQISTHEHPKRFQTGFEIFFGIFLPISTYHP